MTLEDLKEVQKIDTEMLFDVVDICEKHDIEYFLMYGTLLGAVRHAGPIPWDDDVDIGMTRENYNRFLEIAPVELDSKYDMKIMGSGSAKYISEIKIGRKGTLYCMPGTECLDISKQVQLDIFLVDHMRKRNIVCCLIQRILMIMKLNWDEKKLLIICVKKSHKKFKLFFIMALYILHLFRFIFTEEGIERIIYNMFIDNKNQSEYAGVIADSLLKSLWKKEATGSLVKIEYAGRMLYVPSGYDEILKNKYGNYMEFPPENKRYRNNFDEWIFRYE